MKKFLQKNQKPINTLMATTIHLSTQFILKFSLLMLLIAEVMKIVIENYEISMMRIVVICLVLYILDKLPIYFIDKATKKDRIELSELIQMIKKYFNR